MLILKKEDLEKIIAQCRRELPNEACGILSGKNGEHCRTVEKVYEMINTDKTAATFFMDAKEQFRVMKEMRALGVEMAGIYHSHVASRAYPSSHDVEMAFYPEVSYVIVSLIDKKRPDIKSFNIKDGKITEEELKII